MELATLELRPKWSKRQSYQKHNGSVQHESNQSIGNESHDAKRIDVGHGHTRDIGEKRDNAVGDGTGRGVVVQRDKGVHLELGRAEETLDHNQTQSLEDDTANLNDETKHVELDLTEGGNNHTNHNDGHIAEGLEVGGSNSEGPGGKQGCNGIGGLQRISIDWLWVFRIHEISKSTYLQHLNERNTEVKVGKVTADQTQTEHDTNGHNGTTII